jgi:hypothetical protein
MKLICKCGNVEEIITEDKMKYFEFRNCNDGTIAVICKKCSEIMYVICK